MNAFIIWLVNIFFASEYKHSESCSNRSAARKASSRKGECIGDSDMRFIDQPCLYPQNKDTLLLNL